MLFRSQRITSPALHAPARIFRGYRPVKTAEWHPALHAPAYIFQPGTPRRLAAPSNRPTVYIRVNPNHYPLSPSSAISLGFHWFTQPVFLFLDSAQFTASSLARVLTKVYGFNLWNISIIILLVLYDETTLRIGESLFEAGVAFGAQAWL